MRIFIALLIPDRLIKAIRDWQITGTPGVPSARFRWVKPENLHVTLIAPFYASDEEIRSEVEPRLSGVVLPRTFPVRFEKVLFGPPGRMKRLIWAEGRTPKEFVALKNALEKELVKFVRPENRPPLLHLTIARFQPRSENELPYLDEKVDWSFNASEIAIMESVLKRAGAEYTPLKIFKLG